MAKELVGFRFLEYFGDQRFFRSPACTNMCRDCQFLENIAQVVKDGGEKLAWTGHGGGGWIFVDEPTPFLPVTWVVSRLWVLGFEGVSYWMCK